MAYTIAVRAPSPADDDRSLAAPFAAELGVDGILMSQYYELRLARESEQIDYLVAFSRDRAARLRELVGASIAGNPAYQTLGWRAIERLLNDWLSGASLSAQRTPCIWFELDDFAYQPVGTVPSLSVCLTPAYSIDRPNAGGTHDDLVHARELLEILDAPPRAAVGLEDAFESLPSGARWIHLSYMLGRKRQAVKLYGVMQRDHLLPYLRRIGWAGNERDITEVLKGLYPSELLGDELYLDLNLDDFRESSRCTLGLAVAQQHLRRGRDDDPARTRILRAWEAAGLCDAEKVLSVQNWPHSADNERKHFFARDLRYLDVKLVWHAATGLQAKAYLGCQPKRGLF